MKKLIIAILIACLAIIGLISPVHAEMATMDEAQTIAENWMTLIVHEEGHWAGSTSPKIKEIEEFKRGERTLGYFCLVEPQGYIVISLHKELAPIKAYSTYRAFDPESDEGPADLVKGGMERVLNAIEKQIGPIKSARSQDIEKVLEINYRSAWEEFGGDVTVFKQELKSGALKTNYQSGEVLLSSNWHQKYPYNEQCPDKDCVRPHCYYNENALVGCVATAGAQVMRYWNWPPYGEDSPYNIYYDWPNMPDLFPKTYWPYCVVPPQDQIDAVAELCSLVGVAVGMGYGCNESEAHFASYPGKDLLDAFEDHYYYSHDADNKHRKDYWSPEGWFNRMKEDLNRNRPIPYRIPTDSGGHVIVADGWKETGSTPLREYHINYGWGDGYTMWYTLDALYMSTGTKGEKMLINIVPDRAVGSSLSGTYTSGSFPYRYFDQDATGSSATFASGQYLQFLPGIKVTGTGGTGQSIRFEGSSSASSYLSSGADFSKGIHIQDGAIKLSNHGSIALGSTLGAPRYLRATDKGSTYITITWEDRFGDQDYFEIERLELGSWKFYSLTAAQFFTDWGVYPRATYSYRVRAVKLNGVKSDYSYELKVMMNPPP